MDILHKKVSFMPYFARKLLLPFTTLLTCSSLFVGYASATTSSAAQDSSSHSLTERLLSPSLHCPTHQPTNPYGVFARGDGSETGFGPVATYGTQAGIAEQSGILNCQSDDPLDSYKYMKLNDTGSIWLSLSGETRIRNWYDQHPVFGAYTPASTPNSGPGPRRPYNSGRFAVRNLWSADLHLGSHIRFFGQLINADAGGWKPYGYDGTFRKTIDAQQAFIELNGHVFGGNAGLIFGRQQFLDAPDYMLGNRDVFNVPLSWDGVRLYERWNRVRLDAYDFVQTKNNHPTGSQSFRDTEDYSTRLYGFNLSIAPKDFTFMGEKGYSFLDLFYIGYKMAGAPAQATVMYNPSAWGSTTRNNFGLRWHGQAGPLDFSFGGIYQQGIFHQADANLYNGSTYQHYDNKRRGVNAFAINSNFAYNFRHVMTHPYLGIQADVYSGGGAKGSTSSMNSYIEPFGVNTNYLDPTNYLTGSNLVNFAPKFGFTPLKKLSVEFKYSLYWRYSKNDDTYSVYGRNSFPNSTNPAYNKGSYVGMAPQLAVSYQLGPHLRWDQHAVYFVTSHNMHQMGARSSAYYQSDITLTY